jgi:hypothetical protein
MFDEGKEHHPEDADPAFAQTIPLVWTNPVTGERALQVHAIIVYQIHYRENPTDEFKIIDDLKTVRQMLDDIQRPFITPENVLFAPTEEGGELGRLRRPSFADAPRLRLQTFCASTTEEFATQRSDSLRAVALASFTKYVGLLCVVRLQA